MTTISGKPDRTQVLHTFGEDESTGWFKFDDFQHPLAAKLCVFVYGGGDNDFGSGTVTVQIAPGSDGAGAVEEGTELTDDGVIELTGYAPDMYFRATIAGSTDPTVVVKAA